MTSSAKFVDARLFKLRYSSTVFSLEIAFFSLLAASLIAILSMPWLWLWLFALILLVDHFFRYLSVIHQFSDDFRIEFRMNPSRVICYDHKDDFVYGSHQVKTYLSPWFVLLELNHPQRTRRLLLLSDSFQNNSDYAIFRRQLIELKHHAS